MKKCGTCNAWKKVNGKQGACRAHPPVPLMLGFAQRPSLGSLGPKMVAPPEPQIMPFFPGMMEDDGCREWQPKEEDLNS